MSKRSNTAALASPPVREGEEKTTSVRKIDNGFIVRESSWNAKTGESRSSERFSSDGKVGNGGAVGHEGLSDTKTYLGKDV